MSGNMRMLTVCDDCIAGTGRECHNPVCGFFLRDVPPDGANPDMSVPVSEEADDEVLRRIIDTAFGTDAVHGLIAARLVEAGWHGPGGCDESLPPVVTLVKALRGHRLDTMSQDSGNHCVCGSDSRFEQRDGDLPWKNMDEHRAHMIRRALGGPR